MVGNEPAHKHGSGPTFQSEIWKDWAIPNNCPTAEFKNIYRNIKISTPQKLKAHNAWHEKKQGQMSHDEKKTQLVKTDQEFTKAIIGLGAQPSRSACLTCTGPRLNLQLHGNKKTIFDISTGFEESLSLSNTDMRGIKKKDPGLIFRGKNSHMNEECTGWEWWIRYSEARASVLAGAAIEMSKQRTETKGDAQNHGCGVGWLPVGQYVCHWSPQRKTVHRRHFWGKKGQKVSEFTLNCKSMSQPRIPVICTGKNEKPHQGVSLSSCLVLVRK